MSRAELGVRVARTLGLPESTVAAAADGQSFPMLGGSSLQAIDFVAACARTGWDVPLADLMSRTPIGAVLDAARPRDPGIPEATSAPYAADRYRPTLPGQAGMLRQPDAAGDRAYHLLFTGEIRSVADHRPVTADDVAEAVRRVVDRHAALRTYFVPSEDAEDGVLRCVRPSGAPWIQRSTIRVPRGARATDLVNSSLAGSSARLLAPFDRPPVHFTITEVRTDVDERPPILLSVLAHHALLDGWSFGVLFRELAALLAGRPLTDAPDPEVVLAEHARLRRSGELDRIGATRVAELGDAPPALDLPSDLSRPPHQDLAAARRTSALSAEAMSGWAATAAELGVSQSAVLLAAWAAVLARRAGAPEVVIGVPTAGRHRPGWDALVAAIVQMVPVRCRLGEDATVAEYVTGIADELTAAVRAADVPFEELVRRLGVPRDPGRPPLVQAVLAPNDELRSRHVVDGPVRIEVFEGFCGGVGFDLVLQTWSNIGSPDLVCDHACAVHTPDEVAELLDAMSATLVEFGRDLTQPMRAVRTISRVHRRRLDSLRAGVPVPPPTADLWHTIAEAARRVPDTVAVRDGDPTRALTYRQLLHAAEIQARALLEAGVGEGDVVAYVLPKSVEEIVTALAVLRVGAVYAGINESDPDKRIRQVLQVVRPAVLVTGRTALARMLTLAPSDCRSVAVLDPMAAAGSDPASVPAAPPSDPHRIAYIMSTSGSTGVPKAIRLRNAAILRLVTGQRSVCRPGDRMMRIAPPAFDLSPFEMYGALTAGASLEIHPDAVPSADSVADFVQDRAITVAWVPAGLFGVIGAHRPECFRGVRTVYTGGEVVAPDAARAVSTACPQTTVVNGYGPAENGSFTSYYVVTDPSDVDDPLPIGEPVPGTGILLLDQNGELVPPGAVGELCTTGAGLAVDYFGNAEATEAAFGRPAPDTGERLYRTGDLARWDGAGRLRFLGRGDHQVKIGGHRVELSEVRDRLLACPGVRAVAVVGVRAGTSNVALAAVVPEPDQAVTPTLWQDRLTQELPPYAIPALWAIVPEIPLTTNGKTDRDALREQAVPLPVLMSTLTRAGDAPPTQESTVEGPGMDDRAADIVTDVWAAVLGSSPGNPDSNFFDEGGTSLQIAKMVLRLRRKHGLRLDARQLYEAPTVRQMVSTVAARMTDDRTE